MTEPGAAGRDSGGSPHVVIVGSGFAGLACAKELAKHKGIRVTVVDRNNFHQFQPLLYQVATCQLAVADVAFDIRAQFRERPDVDVKRATVTAIDPDTGSVTLDTGSVQPADYLVLACGGTANFFGTPGAQEHALPLYSLEDAERLRTRILEVFEDADRDPTLLDQGALTFVIVGAGATGTEVAGSLAELIRDVMPDEYRDLDVAGRAKVVIVDHGEVVLNGFSDSAHAYASRALLRDGVELRLGTSVREVGPGHVGLSDGSSVPTRCVVWAGGMAAAPLVSNVGVPTGAGGRVDVLPDLTVSGHPRLYVLGDSANTQGESGAALPQLGAVAQQAGAWAARNIVAEVEGGPRADFEYRDKGIMAMIGRNAAVAEVGEHRHELHGAIAFSAWLGVHAMLLSGMHQRVDAFVSWAWDYFHKSTRGPQLLDASAAPQIDWGEDVAVDAAILPAGGTTGTADTAPVEARRDP